MIYFAQEDSGHIKIGYTEGEPEARIKSLQTGSPTPITLLLAIEGDRAAENGLHQRFSKHRLCGEWFKPSPEIVSYIISQSASLGAAKAFQSAATSRPHTASPWPLKIYLAGKISDSSWRNAIVDGLNGEYQRIAEDCEGPCSELLPSLLNREWPVLERSVESIHSYVGPYFIPDCPGDCDNSSHGCCPCDSFFGEDNHGAGLSWISTDFSENKFPRGDIVAKCLSSIDRSNFLFAWIDQLDCYGTIVEIGYALKLGIPVYVSSPREFRDMWFVFHAAIYGHGFDSAPAACAWAISDRKLVLDRSKRTDSNG